MGLLQMLGITALAGMGGTGAGGAVSCLLHRDSDRMVSLLLSFAAGVMVAVVCFDLLNDALHPEGCGGQTPLGLIAAGVLLGHGAVCGLNAALGHKKRNAGKVREGLFRVGFVMAAAIALHNVPEGMVIGASFVKDAGAELPRGGAMMAVVIGLHNVPEGMAVAAPLIAGGMTKRRVIAVTALTGAPTIAGAAVGYYLGTLGPRALVLALSFASGAMLYVVFGELLPEASGLWRSPAPALAAVVGILMGMMIFYL